MDELFDEKSCLNAVRAGDEMAACQLVDYLYPFIIRVVRGRLPRMMCEEDMTQEVFSKVFQKLEQYKGEVDLSHWVSRIALTTCFDGLRRQKRRPEVRLADLSEEEEAVIKDLEYENCTVDQINKTSALEVVERLLSELDPEDAAIIKWMELEDKSVRDIKEITGWGESMVKVRAFRARRKLRKIYEKLIKKEVKYE